MKHPTNEDPMDLVLRAELAEFISGAVSPGRWFLPECALMRLAFDSFGVGPAIVIGRVPDYVIHNFRAGRKHDPRGI